MAAESPSGWFQLPACRELLETHPESVRIREQVEALEAAVPDNPGTAVSFCRSILETTCKTILADHDAHVDPGWEANKLISETLKYLELGRRDDGSLDPSVKAGADSLVRGLNFVVKGISEIRNVHGTAAHGQDAYAPLLDSSYVEIVARATDAVVGLLFKSHLKLREPSRTMRFGYGDQADFDEFIDGQFGPFEVLEVPLVASEALYHTDFNAYRTALVQFREERESGDESTLGNEEGGPP